MLHLKIISIGKTKETWLNVAIEEYLKRMQGVLKIECIWAKDNAHLLKLVQEEKTVICFDAEGEHYSSEKFSKFFFSQMQAGGSHLAFVIGGAEGLPKILKERTDNISLSAMTFTHQCVRLLIIEQVYRAIEINKGTKYHK